VEHLTGNQQIALSVITITELAHGVTRAQPDSRRARRKQFLDELMTAVPIQPISTSIALRAGTLDGELQARGVRVALADLLIGVSALELGYAVGTSNVRHFRHIPGLEVVEIGPLG
jgi:predicted nucleic acid-binding protein